MNRYQSAEEVLQALNSSLPTAKTPKPPQRQPSPTIPFRSSQSSPNIKKLETFSFKTVRLNRFGQVEETKTGRAEYFAEDLGKGVKLEMVKIPAGGYYMGTPETEIERLNKLYNTTLFSRESPQHWVNVPEFYIGKYPITQAQWKAVMEGNNPYRFKGDNRPVEQVSWDDAKKFCERLSYQTGRTYRLPSEAEWEYVCRGINPPAFGTPLSNGDRGRSKEEWNEKYNQPFNVGETITSDYVNFYGTSTYASAEKGEYRGETVNVDYFQYGNGFGLYQMHGNVWEWCEDTFHESYENAPVDGTAWVDDSNNTKILRGGSCHNFPRDCRSAFRFINNPDSRLILNGFRVVARTL